MQREASMYTKYAAISGNSREQPLQSNYSSGAQQHVEPHLVFDRQTVSVQAVKF